MSLSEHVGGETPLVWMHVGGEFHFDNISYLFIRTLLSQLRILFPPGPDELLNSSMKNFKHVVGERCWAPELQR